MIKPRPALFKWRHFEPEIIVCAVRWYLRFSLSYRDVKELLMEQGLPADCNGLENLDKKLAFLKWWAALKMKESQCPERARVTRPSWRPKSPSRPSRATRQPLRS